MSYRCAAQNAFHFAPRFLHYFPGVCFWQRYLVQKRIFRKIIYIIFYRIYLVKVAVCREVPTPPFTSPFSAVVVHVVWPSSLPRSPVVFSSYSEAQKRRGEGDGTAYASRKRERGGGGDRRRFAPRVAVDGNFSRGFGGLIFPSKSHASFAPLTHAVFANSLLLRKVPSLV